MVPSWVACLQLTSMDGHCYYYPCFFICLCWLHQNLVAVSLLSQDERLFREPGRKLKLGLQTRVQGMDFPPFYLKGGSGEDADAQRLLDSSPGIIPVWTRRLSANRGQGTLARPAFRFPAFCVPQRKRGQALQPPSSCSWATPPGATHTAPNTKFPERLSAVALS